MTEDEMDMAAASMDLARAQAKAEGERLCVTCRFYVSKSERCRRYPFTIIGKLPHEWCGEWEERSEADSLKGRSDG